MRLFVEEKANLLRDAVFSASDGIVTTFAVVAGSAGASLSKEVVLILGFANLFADGFSMAAGNYMGTQSELEYEKVRGGDYKHSAPPLIQSIVTFVAFNIAGFIPLAPYVFSVQSSFSVSAILVVIELFTIGVLRSVYTKKSWLKGGFEILLIGGFAALVAFVTGELLKRITS